MESALFEKLALLGRAQWITVNIATFDAATIKTPTNGFLLLKQILYNHFCDANGTDTTPGAMQSHTVHGLSISEKGSKTELYYNLRSAVLPVSDIGGKFSPVLSASPNTIIPTFKIFRNDVTLGISRVQDMKDFASATGKMNENSEERAVPLGFGVAASGLNVEGITTFPAPDSGKYYPNGDSRIILGVTNPANAGANYRDQFRNPVNASTQLNRAPGVITDARNIMAPFITLGFWYVTGSPEEVAKLV